jgi:hypothetical protein
MKGELDEVLIKLEKWIEDYVDTDSNIKNLNYFQKVRHKEALLEEAENLLLKHLRKCRVKHIRNVRLHSHKSLDFNQK